MRTKGKVHIYCTRGNRWPCFCQWAEDRKGRLFCVAVFACATIGACCAKQHTNYTLCMVLAGLFGLAALFSYVNRRSEMKQKAIERAFYNNQHHEGRILGPTMCPGCGDPVPVVFDLEADKIFYYDPTPGAPRREHKCV